MFPESETSGERNSDQAAVKKRIQNRYFITNAQLVSSLIPFIPNDERTMVNKWIDKLISMNPNDEDERVIRNDYIWFLLIQLESGAITLPFIRCPPKCKLLPVSDSVEKCVYENILRAANNRSQYQDHVPITGDKNVNKVNKCQKCLPSEFHSKQPVPNIGFIVYGSCFSDQMS